MHPAPLPQSYEHKLWRAEQAPLDARDASCCLNSVIVSSCKNVRSQLSTRQGVEFFPLGAVTNSTASSIPVHSSVISKFFPLLGDLILAKLVSLVITNGACKSLCMREIK